VTIKVLREVLSDEEGRILKKGPILFAAQLVAMEFIWLMDQSTQSATSVAVGPTSVGSNSNVVLII